MSSARYAYRFTIGARVVHPIYERSASKSLEREQNRVFHREKFNGTLELLRADFNALWANTLETELDILIERRDSAGTYAPYMAGKITKMDGIYDEDNRRVKINPKPMDKYNKILGAMSKEYDLVKDLNVEKYNVLYKKQPLIQIAFPYHNVLYNRIGVTTFLSELPIGGYTSTELEDFGFVHEDPVRVYIPGNNDMVPDVSGIYEQTGPTQYERLDGVYRISRAETTRWTISQISGGSIVYRGIDGVANMLDRSPFETTPETILESVSDPGVSFCAPFPIWMHQRILTDATTIGGTPTIPLPQPDIADLVFNYDNYIDQSGFTVPPINVVASDAHTTTPNQYGKFNADALHFAGEYFNPTIVPFTLTLGFPLMQPSWGYFSLVEYTDGSFYAEILEAATTVTLRDAYKLTDVLRALLERADPSIVFMDDVVHSDFLFNATNPITTEAQSLTHFITPKSNIVTGDYDNAAPKAPISLQHVDELLMYGPNLHWFIDPAYAFILEHIHYYKNGRSYTAPITSNDLTVQENPHNDKPWAYHTKKYRYKEEQIPERITSSWMDDVSDIFDGLPIEILSPFAEKGNIQTNAITRFTSDLDYIQAAKDVVSREGLCVMAAELNDDDEYEVPFTPILLPVGFNVSIQNGYWSFTHLHEKFHKHNLPSDNVKINGVETTATTVKRSKEQVVIYPAPIEPDPMRLLVTSIGRGEVEKLDINMTTRAATITVLHDLDFDNPCPTC